MIERERTFLLKKKPKGLKKCNSVEITDIFIPQSDDHPILRIRKRGEKYMITKKEPIEKKDSSKQEENTIILNKKEFKELSGIKGKRFRKIRYFYPFKNLTAEIDFYQDKLKGLAVVDFEFETDKQKDKFKMPKFCLADITQEKFCAGGILAGKSYAYVKPFLEKYGYKKINIHD